VTKFFRLRAFCHNTVRFRTTGVSSGLKLKLIWCLINLLLHQLICDHYLICGFPEFLPVSSAVLKMGVNLCVWEAHWEAIHSDFSFSLTHTSLHTCISHHWWLHSFSLLYCSDYHGNNKHRIRDTEAGFVCVCVCVCVVRERILGMWYLWKLCLLVSRIYFSFSGQVKVL